MFHRNLAALLLIVSCSPALLADDGARTAQLPPALSALQPSADQLLTKHQAHQVRGQMLLFRDSGVVVQLSGSGVVDGGQFAIEATGGGQTFSFVSTINGVQFSASGIAITGGVAPKQGVLVTQTGVFNGGAAFSGVFTEANVVALPGLFALEIR